MLLFGFRNSPDPRAGENCHEPTIRANYNGKMARGWESKSVEAQQAEAVEKSTKPRFRLSPEQAARSREKEGIRLSRQRVAQQLQASQNSRHRKLLEDALAELDERLRRF